MDTASRLILFADVIDSGSFSKAAERRSVNRSLVSKQIAKLEEHLGVRLLHRTTRSLSLTDDGRAIYQHACTLRNQLMETDALVASLRDDVTGELRISSTTHFGRLHVLPVVEAMATEHPGLSVELRLEDRYVDIVGERYDAAIRITEPDDSSLVARKLADNPFVMVASPAYLEQHEAPQTPKDLDAHRFVVYAGDYGVNDQWTYLDGAEIKSFIVNARIKVNDGYALLKSAQNGMGIALTPTFVSGEALQDGSLVQVLPGLALTLYSPIYIMYPSRSHLSNKTRLFIDRMVEYVGQPAFWNEHFQDY